jgi:hypothetical protein
MAWSETLIIQKRRRGKLPPRSLYSHAELIRERRKDLANVDVNDEDVWTSTGEYDVGDLDVTCDDVPIYIFSERERKKKTPLREIPESTTSLL